MWTQNYWLERRQQTVANKFHPLKTLIRPNVIINIGQNNVENIQHRLKKLIFIKNLKNSIRNGYGCVLCSD